VKALPLFFFQQAYSSPVSNHSSDAKFSTDREQDLHLDFVPSVLDGRKIALTDADSISKIGLSNVDRPRDRGSRNAVYLAIGVGTSESFLPT
jgi:hypothetical protein